ncbi:DUF4235 domain-containing protein [Branchiibius sp. NY16-3462-2]|uniref:DUF4235 domain-containing protein n=1 Tax=Branchiibius sp. NY16-3462-2 TaxID=1807500 RepID=UPI00079A560F|nr:DUF4235 domain-containing protein [Branchiibius sp. NY16-3462-2]KYH43406.1 hypothetical protein AZH51_16740 [Branchiibius sp. NY16-3462-2]
MKGNIGWKLIALASGVVASRISRAVTKGGWKAVTGKPMPLASKDPSSSAVEALVFAGVSAAVMAVTRTFVDRKAADFYEKSTGHAPPPVEHLREKS